MRLYKKSQLALFGIMIVLSITGLLFAQDEGVVMLEEITITVDPEMPNVLVTIPRENPIIEVGELKRPRESQFFDEPVDVKPKLVDIEINEVEKPQKMLAKDRK